MEEEISRKKIIKYRFRWKRNKGIRTGLFAALAFLLLLLTGYRLLPFPLLVILYGLTELTDIRLSRRYAWLWTGLLYIVGALFTERCVQHVILDAEEYAKTSGKDHFLNFLLYLSVYLVLHALTARPRYVPLLAHGICLFVGFADYFVYQFRENEIVLSDLQAAQTGLSVMESYHPELHDRGAAVLLLALIWMLFVWKLNVRPFYRKLSRLIALAAALLCAVIVLARTKNYETQTWELKGSAQNGFFLNFVLSIRDSVILPPEGYSDREVAALEAAYGDPDVPEQEIVPADPGEAEPTVIVIMNESLADLSILGDLETNDEVLPFWKSLHKNTVKGYALASVFGAKTPNSEWEFLSGGSMAFLPAGSVVYQQYLDEAPFTLTETMNDLGYTTVAMHPYYSSGWSRDLVYPAMGFDETFFLDDGYFNESRTLRKYIKDQELYDKIIDRYEEKAEGERLFFFGVTMQNHGGYTHSWPGFTEKITAEPGIYGDVNQYLTLARASDDALRNLVGYFEEKEEPVVIVCFGDHQPSLNAVFYRQMNQKGMDGLTMDELEDFYSVPFFIWTNYESEAVTFERTSLNYLSTMTLQRAGIALPPGNRFLAELMTRIPAINARGYWSKDMGCFLHLADAQGEEAEWIRRYRILQYNGMFDENDRSQIFFPEITDE